VKDIDERNRLVEDHLYMVDILIRKYLGKGVEYDDLYQVASLGLVEAATRYDPDKGAEFKTYATTTILGEIKKYFRDTQWDVKVPRGKKEKALKVREAEDRLTAVLERTPTVRELADETGFSDEEIIEALESAKAYAAYSLDKEYNDDEDSDTVTLGASLGFEETGYERVEIAEIIKKVVGGMSDTARYVFRQRFLENKTQADIATALGVSQMTISRTEKNIVEKFRKELKAS